MSNSPLTGSKGRSCWTMGQPEVRCRRMRSRGRTDRSETRRSRFRASKEPISTSPGYGRLTQPGNGQLGVIGDDLLSRFTVELTDSTAFLSAESCRPEALAARGLTPVAQNGFFSSDPSRISAGFPNVPVVFLRLGEVRAWAQIDTGYEDSVYPRSVDINQALFDRLAESGVRLDKVGDINIWTCDGRERRPVYRVKDRPLAILTRTGEADRRNRRLSLDRQGRQRLRRHRGHGRARGPARRLVSAPVRRRHFRSGRLDRLAGRRAASAADAAAVSQADCAASVASRAPTASRSRSCALAAMSSIEGEFASSERARPTISALLGM